MIFGRADSSDDWLPARIGPVRGESFDSLCRRLAAANGITPTELLRACLSRQPDAQTPMVAVARCIGGRGLDGWLVGHVEAQRFAGGIAAVVGGRAAGDRDVGYRVASPIHIRRSAARLSEVA